MVNEGSINYNSLQAQYEKLLGREVNLLANYTWSRFLGYGSDSNSFNSLLYRAYLFRFRPTDPNEARRRALIGTAPSLDCYFIQVVRSIAQCFAADTWIRLHPTARSLKGPRPTSASISFLFVPGMEGKILLRSTRFTP
jgi:hypothetical protein